MGYNEVNQYDISIDSIFLYSSTDSVKLPTYEFSESIGVFVITADSLDSEFIINRYADTITVVVYVFDEPFEDFLIFGNIAGASISYPRQGQSISKYWRDYNKDNSPTIGLINDTIGMCGTIKGIIYDKYLLPVESQTFMLDEWFKTFDNGEYSARVYSKPSSFNRIDYRTGHYNTHSVSISDISYIMEPDSVIEMNIYLLDTLITEINNLDVESSLISVYPNSISKRGELKINIDLPIITSDVYIEIIDINGKLINKNKIVTKLSSVEAPDKAGLYIVRTILDLEVVASNMIIVNE